jgi:hypothetical protein
VTPRSTPDEAQTFQISRRELFSHLRRRAQRTTGSQLTYNAHLLYTYVGDTAPGQANGNDLNLNGGLWHEVRVSQ